MPVFKSPVNDMLGTVAVPAENNTDPFASRTRLLPGLEGFFRFVVTSVDMGICYLRALKRRDSGKDVS